MAHVTNYRGIILPITGPAQGIQWSEHPPLISLQSLVDGLIEVVHVQGLHPGFTLLVNEEGHVKDLPHNRTASALAGLPLFGPALLLLFELE